MRLLIDVQDRLVFSEPTLEETRRVYQRYERISNLLDRSPEIVRAVHDDLVEAQASNEEQSSAGLDRPGLYNPLTEEARRSRVRVFAR